MKLVQEDEKNSLNGVSKEDVGDKEIEEITANGDDLLCADSRSNADSLSSEDALMKDNGAKEGSQNGSGRHDDTRSWSSGSSILPSPAGLEDDFSEDLRLQISDEEEEDSKSILTETALEKDSPHLPSIGEPSFSDDKNPFRELLDDEGCDTLQKTIKDTPQPNETVEEASSSISPIHATNNLDNNDSVNDIHNENNIISDNKESGGKSNLDDLIADIVPDNKLLNELSTKSDNDSVSELRQEIEDVLKKGDDLDTESTGKISTIDDASKQSADKIEVDSNNHHKIEETVNKIQGTDDIIEDINEKIENINDKIEDTDNKIKKIDAKNEDSENKIEDISKFEETDKKIEVIDNKIEEIDNQIDIDNKIEETNNKIQETDNEIEETGNKCEEIEDKIEETDDKIEEIHNKIEDTNNKIEDTVKKMEESAAVIDDSDITIEDSDIKIEESGHKIEDTHNKIQNSDNKIEETNIIIETDNKIEDTVTEKEDLPEKKIENDALNMEIDENPNANNDDNAEESDISNSEALDLLEKEDNITNSVPDNNQISKDNDDVMDVVMEDNSETSNVIEEISEKSSEEPVVETTRPPGVTTNMEEPMEITEIDNVEDTEKEIDSSTAEEADIVSAENIDVQLNKIEKELTKNSIVENTSTDTKEIVKEEIKAEETKKEGLISELNEGTTEIPKCLKRSLEEEDDNIDAKKPKINGLAVDPPKKREYVALNFLRNLMAKKDVKSMTRLEMEELCLQKMCEVVNQTSKIGELQRTLKQQEHITEGLRTKYAGLKKQISDLSIVHTKIMQEMKSKLPDGIKDGSTIRDIMPVKITRSVGLQVNLQAGMRAMRVQPSAEKTLPAPTVPVQKRKIQRTSLPNRLPSTQQPTVPTPTPAKPIGATIPKSPNAIPFQNSTPKPGIKTILPKESTTPANSPSLLSNYLLSSPANSKASTPPTATRKTPVPTTTNSSSATTATIDLTDEDDKTAGVPTPTSTAPSIRVVNPQLMGQVTTATTKSVPITYLVAPNQPQQVILTSNNSTAKPGQARPAFMLRSVPGQVQQGLRLNIMRPQTPGTNQGLVLPSANATIRTSQPLRIQQVPTTTTTNSIARTQMSSGRVTRHPAPLPGPPAVQPSQPTWKAMPPKPSLKISRVGDGIVLSWKMLNKNMSLYEDIASYQLYAYQETSSAPATEMWRKVGDVKALALPMACTLTQFTDGNKYHFAVRAVDVKSRVGPFSQPEQIALP